MGGLWPAAKLLQPLPPSCLLWDGEKIERGREDLWIMTKNNLVGEVVYASKAKEEFVQYSLSSTQMFSCFLESRAFEFQWLFWRISAIKLFSFFVLIAEHGMMLHGISP